MDQGKDILFLGSGLFRYEVSKQHFNLTQTHDPDREPPTSPLWHRTSQIKTTKRQVNLFGFNCFCLFIGRTSPSRESEEFLSRDLEVGLPRTETKGKTRRSESFVCEGGKWDLYKREDTFSILPKTGQVPESSTGQDRETSGSSTA